MSPLKNLPPFKKTKQKNSKILFAIFHFAMCEMISQAKRPRPQSFPVFQHTEIRCNTSPWRHRRKRKKKIREEKPQISFEIPPPLASKIPEKRKKKKMANIRNQKKKKKKKKNSKKKKQKKKKKKKKLLPHTPRDNLRGLPLKKKKKRFRPWIVSVYIQSLERNVKNDVCHYI